MLTAIRDSAEAIPEFAYRKVAVDGRFDFSNEILLGPRTRDGKLGYYVITPLLREDGGSPILVNRGFVTRERADRQSRPRSLVL
jgi:surfeit locus 1 family protein